MERLSRLRITDRESLLCLSLTILALLVALVVAASAQADEAASGPTPGTGESQEAPNGQNSAESPALEGQSSPTAGGSSGEATPTEATPREAAPEGASPPPSEESLPQPSEESTVKVAPEETGATPAPTEATSGATAPEGQSAGPTPVVTEEAVVTPPAEVTKELTQQAPAEAPEESAGKAPAGEHGEGAGEASPSTPPHSASPTDTPVAQLDIGHAAAPAEAPVATSAEAGLPIVETIAATELEGPPRGGGPTAPAHAGMTPVQRAGSFSCELSQLGGQLTDNCTVGWLAAPRFAAVADVPSGLVTVAASLVVATIAGTPSEGGHGGVAISSPPVGPAPSSPSPGGAAGAATGGSGVAPLSTFLTLAGLLLLGAPRVLRRLRLSCEPWLAGCFVLVPERPD
jgi:hypothetical protein